MITLNFTHGEKSFIKLSWMSFNLLGIKPVLRARDKSIFRRNLQAKNLAILIGQKLRPGPMIIAVSIALTHASVPAQLFIGKVLDELPVMRKGIPLAKNNVPLEGIVVPDNVVKISMRLSSDIR